MLGSVYGAHHLAAVVAADHGHRGGSAANQRMQLFGEQKKPMHLQQQEGARTQQGALYVSFSLDDDLWSVEC